MKNRALIVLVVVVIVALVSLIRISMNVKKARKGFQQEMALRLDFEEKAINLEKENSSLTSELKNLSSQAGRLREALETVKEELRRQEEEKVLLRASLAKANQLLQVQRVPDKAQGE